MALKLMQYQQYIASKCTEQAQNLAQYLNFTETNNQEMKENIVKKSIRTITNNMVENTRRWHIRITRVMMRRTRDEWAMKKSKEDKWLVGKHVTNYALEIKRTNTLNVRVASLGYLDFKYNGEEEK